MEEDVEIPCEVCGTHATRYITNYPICNNVVCYVTRLEDMKELVKKMNNKIASKAVEEN